MSVLIVGRSASASPKFAKKIATVDTKYRERIGRATRSVGAKFFIFFNRTKKTIMSANARIIL